METIEQIHIDEGYEEIPYLCSEGYLSWLHGRNIEEWPITALENQMLKKTIEDGGTLKTWAGKLFLENLKVMVGEMSELYDFDISKYDQEIRAILCNMLYNMGVTRFNPIKWPNFFNALKRGDLTRCAIEMEYRDNTCQEKSKWYLQTGNRSKRLVESMRRLSFDEVM
ncbi:MAG: hypothetical protein GY800_08945 [Planctomycetes bacterium]|nr:hypothetical protein [Planctomycetota bacterium]